MSYLPEHLSSLRREIIELQKSNARYSETSNDSRVEKAGSELRVIRLLQIKQELSNMLTCSGNYAVWWDKKGKHRAA
jgi:hypothetical protein